MKIKVFVSLVGLDEVMSSTNSANVNVREEVITILKQFEDSSQTLRQIIRQHLSAHSFSFPVAARIQSLALGVIQYKNTIDFILNRSRFNISLKEIPKMDLLRLRLALFEGRWQKISTQILESFLKEKKYLKILTKAINLDLVSAVKSMKSEEQKSILYSHPTFLVHTLTEKLGEKETISLMKKNNSSFTSYLRINQLISNPNEILSSLIEKKIILEQDKDLPFLYVIKDGMKALIDTNAFKTGKIFIQDKASILAVKTLDPQPGDFIWDACAAPGMKTHLIWEFMKGEGTLIASDIHYQRLQSAQKRFLSYGINQVEWIHTDAANASIPNAKKILIDAPCTSTGIIQSHPSYKWRLNKKWLFSIMTIQNKILDGIISKYLDKPGTEILYSTCSVLPHEGENQIDSVLDRYNVELMKGPNFGQTGYPNFKCSKEVRRLFPHTDNTNGFFIAHLKISE